METNKSFYMACYTLRMDDNHCFRIWSPSILNLSKAFDQLLLMAETYSPSFEQSVSAFYQNIYRTEQEYIKALKRSKYVRSFNHNNHHSVKK